MLTHTTFMKDHVVFLIKFNPKTFVVRNVTLPFTSIITAEPNQPNDIIKKKY